MARAAALLLLILLAPTPSRGQYPQMATYVCQTPTFWCTFMYSSGIPNGASCYCNTMWGPVVGASINPAGVPNAPDLPRPQQPPSPGTPTPTRGTPGEVEADDCYKGLGNCPGSFMRAARSGGGTSDSRDSSNSRDSSTDRRGGSSSAFGSALQELIDAAADDFEDVRGEQTRSGSTSDYYKVTVVPPDMERCTLFVPQRQRQPWVSCFAPDGMTFSRLARLVADALGSSGSRSGDEQTWIVGDVEVQVDRGSSLTLDVRRTRD